MALSHRSLRDIITHRLKGLDLFRRVYIYICYILFYFFYFVVNYIVVTMEYKKCVSKNQCQNVTAFKIFCFKP